MKILHITPHVGGGVGSVIMGWMKKVSDHQILCLDYANDKFKLSIKGTGNLWYDNAIEDIDYIREEIERSDIVLVHYWDHRTLSFLFSRPLPECRLVFWCHKNIPYSDKELQYPDLWIDTSPIQGHGRYIWSCGGISRFLAIKPKKHGGFNIGTVVSMKMDISDTLNMFMKIGEIIPEAYFTWIGDFTPMNMFDYPNVRFLGKVDDIAPYLAEMDVFAYPLRPDHYGTCEQVLGEAMAAGVIPVVMGNPAELKIVQNRWNGFVAYTEEDYISVIKYLYGWNGDLVISKNEMTENARQRAKELYSLDIMIEQWNDVFEKMMEQPKRKRGTL